MAPLASRRAPGVGAHRGGERMEDVDVVVIGAGVVGIAVARALALAGREVIVLDKEEGIGTETSSRNSEVIHAGIYYPKGSLMARFCVEGRRALYAFLDSHKIDYRRCGKLVVATEEAEVERIEAIFQQATANGVEGLEHLTGAQARALFGARLMSRSAPVVLGSFLLPHLALALRARAVMKATSSVASLPLVSVMSSLDNSLKRALRADPQSEAQKPNQEPRRVAVPLMVHQSPSSPLPMLPISFMHRSPVVGILGVQEVACRQDRPCIKWALPPTSAKMILSLVVRKSSTRQF
jgi:phytoene dehydrogenase-like protein